MSFLIKHSLFAILNTTVEAGGGRKGRLRESFCCSCRMRLTQGTNAVHLKSKWGLFVFVFHQNWGKWSNRHVSTTPQRLSHENTQNILKQTKNTLRDGSWSFCGKGKQGAVPSLLWPQGMNGSSLGFTPCSTQTWQRRELAALTELLCILYFQARNRTWYISIDSVVSYNYFF